MFVLYNIKQIQIFKIKIVAVKVSLLTGIEPSFNLHLKKIKTPNKHYLHVLMPLQSLMLLFVLWNTKEDIFKNVHAALFFHTAVHISKIQFDSGSFGYISDGFSQICENYVFMCMCIWCSVYSNEYVCGCIRFFLQSDIASYWPGMNNRITQCF